MTKRTRPTLEREFSFDLAPATTGDGLTLEGYAAVYGQPTRIDNPAEGRFDEVFARGAFDKTLEGRKPVVMWAHGRDPAVGMVPIGALQEARSDDYGLWVSVRLHDNAQTQPIRDAIASGSVPGQSVRFQPVRDAELKRQGDVPLITRTEVKLVELGPVPIPYYAGTTVAVRDVDGVDGDQDDNVCTTCGTATPAAAAASTSSDAAPRGAPLDDAGAPPTATEVVRALTIVARAKAERELWRKAS